MFVFSGLYSPSSAGIQVECQFPTQDARLQLFTQKSDARGAGNFENVVSGSSALKTEPIYTHI